MDKSPEAFRTISEVAETLETPAHVLRFWESRFPQIKPVKRAGGRRYYRPADVALLSGIRHLLHDEGMTIRGVQKILREQGVRHVAALASGMTPGEVDAEIEAEDYLQDSAPQDAALEGAEIVELEPVPRAPLPKDEALGAILQLHPALSAPPTPAPQEKESPAPLAQARVAAEAPVEPAPEARHVWVDDEPELDLAAPLPLFPDERPKAAPPPAASAQAPHVAGPTRVRPAAPVAPATEGLFEGIFSDLAPTPQPKLSGIAARIRALRRPVSPGALAELEELHSRLGLLHAQMAEAIRNRR